MAEETTADLVAEAKDLEAKLESKAETEAAKIALVGSTLTDSGAPSEATKPAEDLTGQAPVEASVAAPESAPEFKDSVGNVFAADGTLLRREDGFGGTPGRKSS